MPSNTRQWAKRKYEQAKENLDWAIYHLGEISELYKELHPEVSNPTDVCCAALVQLQQTLERIRTSF